MINTDEIKQILKIRLSKKRCQHSLNVADMAVKLAVKHGADKDKAYLAGLIHDICKEIPHSEQLIMAKNCGRNFTSEEEMVPALYHGPAASYYAKEVLGIDDEDILNAVRYHTIARGGMSRLEEVVYLADLTSADRDYKDVDEMRELALSDIDRAMYEALRFQISDVLKKGSVIPSHSQSAYNRYAALYLKKNKE
ncbi:MAG: bis(5'-nucleosyl)-tetraphosphatase (symmetrical) YqeK [Oscillospiraceae bacterium]|nr:bis(5'-nucleosyl)-tetraphosphatase (symmetrical) YqeK [Oscillospiraceae bacterium]